jgi:dynein heavy chain
LELSFNELTVKTTESEKIAHAMKMFLEKGIHTLLVGPTGTGKSIIIQNFLAELPQDQFVAINVSFSAQSTSA